MSEDLLAEGFLRLHAETLEKSVEALEERVRQLELALNKAEQWQAELEQVLKKSSDSALRNHLELWLYYRDRR